MKVVTPMIYMSDDLKRIDEKKRLLDAVRPIPAALVRNLQEWFAIEFTYTSNALEGNTLSFSETAMVVEKGITVGGKMIREHLEAINHAQAIDFIESLTYKQRSDLALDDILAIHKIVLQKIDDMNAGVFCKGTLVPLLMEFVEWLQNASEHPIIIAALAHYKLMVVQYDLVACPPKLYAKEGRTARLLMNLLLLQVGYPLAIIKKEQRNTYINAIEHARKTDDFTNFYEVILQAVEYTLDSYLQAIKESDLS